MTTVVMDANIAVALVVPVMYSDRAVDLVGRWRERSVEIAVPGLWGYEVTSALRKAVTAQTLFVDEADEALQYLWALDLEMLPGTLLRHRRALDWAARLGQPVAYDGYYLSTAEELEAPFWTADRRLSDAARSAGADWVRSLFETE